MFQGTCVFTKELIYLLLLQFRQVNHEKKIAKGKLYDKLCTYSLLNENRRHRSILFSVLFIYYDELPEMQLLLYPNYNNCDIIYVTFDNMREKSFK